jgi:hypothetical protein
MQPNIFNVAANPETPIAFSGDMVRNHGQFK